MGRARLDRRERPSRSLNSGLRRPPDSASSRFSVSRALRAGPRRILGVALFGIVSAALLAAATAQAQTSQTVASDWSLKPSGITAGQSFRLLFVTSTTSQATSSNISTYNTFVQGRADTNAALKPFKGEFRAVVSTSAVDARANTLTRSTDTGAPIYWVGGAKVADNYADFYDGSWDSYSGKNEAGTDSRPDVWTGSQADGTKDSGNTPGSTTVRYGTLHASFPDQALGRPGVAGVAGRTASFSLYALSPVITVRAADTTGPTVSTVAVTSNPPSGQGGYYKAGDDIAVTLTFNEGIVVTGTPALEITVGSVDRRGTLTP